MEDLCVWIRKREREYSKRGTYGGDFSAGGSGVIVPRGPTSIYNSCFRGSDSHSTYVWLQADVGVLNLALILV